MAISVCRGRRGRPDRNGGGCVLWDRASDQSAQIPRGRKCKTKGTGNLHYNTACYSYNNGSSSSSVVGNSHTLPEAQPNLCSVPRELVHSTLPGQVREMTSERSPSIPRSSRRREGATEGGLLSVGSMRIYCDVDWDSDCSSAGFQDVETDVDAFMVNQEALMNTGGGMGQDLPDNSDAISSSSYDSTGCLSDSSIDHDLVDDYMRNIDHDCRGGLLLRNDPEYQVPVEYMSNGVMINSSNEGLKDALSELTSTGECYSSRRDLLQMTLGLKGMAIKYSSVPAADRGDHRIAVFSTSTWPVVSARCRTKKPQGAPSLKRHLRKKRIEAVRNDRAAKRGFDLSAVNMVIENIVRKEVDMHCFEPMENRDREQVRKLASIYGLKSGSQGKGRKQFVVVARTTRTRIPDGASRSGLLELLSSSRASLSTEVIDPPSKVRAWPRKSHPQTQNVNRRGRHTPQLQRIGNPQCSGKPSAMYPLSFVLSGTMETTGLASMDLGPPLSSPKPSAKFGSFECHTKGFGSRIMAKMGFVEGAGLGKDGRGIARPIEPITRPKSLGLGALN